MNTLEVINNVLSSFGQPILKETGIRPAEQIKEEPKPIVYNLNIDSNAIVFKNPEKAKQVYEAPVAEVKETNKELAKVKNTKTSKTKSKKAVKKTKNK